MKKYIFSIILALVCGIVSSLFIYKEYNSNKIYYLQIGAYKDKLILNESLSEISNIVIKEDNLYHAYIGMTFDYDLALKIKKIYKKNNINIIIKEKKENEGLFKNELKQYDILLSNSKNFKEIEMILKTILARYDEIKNN